MKKLNLLVISENFLKGGLERHILNQYIGLKNKVNFVFAFENYNKNQILKKSKIYHIKLGNTVNEFIETVKQLVNLIEKEKIDVIHCHPFNSFIPAMFASQITKRPILYTVHGYASLNFLSNINQEILFKTFMSYCKPSVISVSNDYIDILKYDFFIKNTYYLPNAVDTNIYNNIKLEKNNKWILISRLDIDKKAEIVKVLNNINKLGVTLDIIGEGGCRTELEQLVIELKLQKKVKFLGYKLDVHEELKNGYNGVMGLGQVVLEGLSSNLPVLLVGYGKITGLINKNLFEKIRNQNFVNRFCGEELDIQEFKKLNNNIEKYKLRTLVKKYYDVEVVNNEYYKVLNTTDFIGFDQINEIYSEIENHALNDIEFSNSSFLNSKIIYEILKKNLRKVIINSSVLNLFKVQDAINDAEIKLKQLEYKVNTSILKKIFRKIKKIVMKLKK